MRARSLVSDQSVALARNLIGVRERDPVRASRAIRIARGAIAHGSMQKLSELAPFLSLVLRLRPRTVIEVGLGRGGTLWALCRAAAADAVLVSVDLPSGPFGGLARNDDLERIARYGRPGQQVHLVRGDSREPATVERVRRLAPAVDLLLIDGDHTFEGVRADYESYAPLVTAGGLIAFHDILEHDRDPTCQVRRFWLSLTGRSMEITSPSQRHHGGVWGGFGLIRCEPA